MSVISQLLEALEIVSVYVPGSVMAVGEYWVDEKPFGPAQLAVMFAPAVEPLPSSETEVAPHLIAVFQATQETENDHI